VAAVLVGRVTLGDISVAVGLSVIITVGVGVAVIVTNISN
jgi:hypothetical protein